MSVSTFLIDLDSVFDTRLGTLLVNFTKEEVSSVLNIDYYKREIDSFSLCPLSVFLPLYSKRDKKTLANSVRTPMVSFLLDFVKESYKNSINGHTVKKPKIIFNTHPYKLEPEEIDVIKDMFVYLTKGLCLIDFIHSGLDDITPMYLSSNIDAFCLYNYYEWLELHSGNDNLKKITIPKIALFGPRMFFKENSSEDKAFLYNEKIDPFEALEKATEPIVCLKLLTTYLYSADIVSEAKNNIGK